MQTTPFPKRYFLELGSALALYMVLLVGTITLDNQLHPRGAVHLALALTPMLGCLAALWAIMRAIRRMDELQRRIQFEALAFAFAATALGTFGYGFAEGTGLPHLPTFAIWPIMAASWAVGLLFTNRRYQ